jgi:prevent-host-death family protein
MEKALGATEVGRSFGEILEDVADRGDRVVVERQVRPIAAVVPIDVYNQWKRSRADFFERMSQAAGRSNLTAEDADRLAAEAIAAVRAEPPPPC